MKYLILLLLLLGACGGEILICPPENMIAGLCIVDNGLEVSIDEIGRLVEILEEQVQRYYPEVIDLAYRHDREHRVASIPFFTSRFDRVKHFISNVLSFLQ